MQKVTCNICKEYDSLHYRVKIPHKSNWLFVCKRCWLDFSKTEGYKYGGTRKVNKRKKVIIGINQVNT